MTENKDNIKVTALPLDIKWANPEANRAEVSRLLADVDADNDIVVLPEMFSTGFMADIDAMKLAAEAPDGPTMTWLKSMASIKSMAFAGSFLCVDNGKFYNRGFFVKPDGSVIFYDKRHLFCLSPEAKIYTAGKETIPSIEFRGWNIALIVCYDLRFPVWCRNRHNRYDMLLVVANWPQARGFAWKQLLIARAIENQVPVVGANRSGVDDYGDYRGLTYIFDPLGRTVASTESNPQHPISATFSKESLNRYRRQLPVGQDADDFVVGL